MSVKDTWLYAAFDWCDRAAGFLLFGEFRTVSTQCGERPGSAPCRWLCRLLDFVEKDHCKKNAGKA